MSTPFIIEERAGVMVLEWEGHGCRPATDEEVTLYRDLAAALAERDDYRKVLEHLCERFAGSLVYDIAKGALLAKERA